ncbi:MAG: hypothetical protein QNK33_02810, partial [Bacteroidales bacterium]|nr:hypothetical protein [Bacteroidales bacterium]
MHLRLLFATVLTILSISALGQSLFDETPKMTKETPYKISGFIRSGFFLNKPGNKPQLSSGFADLAIKIKTENSSSFKAMADLRFRYGMEFSSESKNLRINEAYVMWYGLWAEIKAGQQIVKWSNSDFFRTQDRMNPRNNLYRTFDDNDRDLGNIMLKLNLRPLSVLDIELLYIPFARPSVLSTGIISIPDIVTIVDLPDLSVSENGGSLGLSSSVHLRNFDWGISWYKGYNPMPAICFESISLPQSDTDPPPSLIIESKLYEISMLASNIEFTAGKSIFRSELTYIGTGSGSNTSAFTSFSEIIFTFGMESSIGNLRFLLEYQGKYIVDFYPSIYEPGFPDSDSLPPGIPPEQLESIVGEQIA